MESAGSRLQADRHRLAMAVVERDYAERPELLQRYGERGRARYLEDAAFHFSFLGAAAEWQRALMFLRYVAWLKVVLIHRGVAEADIRRNLELMRDVLIEELGQDEAAWCVSTVDQALEELPDFPIHVPSFLSGDGPLVGVARDVLNAILRHDRAEALDLIQGEVGRGTSLQDIYVEIFEPVQREVGRLWQTGQVSVAEEHYCTGAAQLIISRVAPLVPPAGAGDDILLLCTDGEQHQFGLNMVADLFAMEGWRSVSLGASVPVRGVVQMIETRRPSLIGISAGLPPNLFSMRDAISQLRASANCPPILVGGFLLNEEADLWRETGADGYAPDAREGVRVARELMAA